MGGDFNDILEVGEKVGGKQKPRSSFTLFRAFVFSMEMQDLGFKGRRWTWGNNREGEGYVEERLD